MIYITAADVTISTHQFEKVNNQTPRAWTFGAWSFRNMRGTVNIKLAGSIGDEGIVLDSFIGDYWRAEEKAKHVAAQKGIKYISVEPMYQLNCTPTEARLLIQNQDLREQIQSMRGASK
tara:strand:- start:658 stop:1014 length:357 start_codon:yes stop_codon:yes gene_type:complete